LKRFSLKNLIASEVSTSAALRSLSRKKTRWSLIDCNLMSIFKNKSQSDTPPAHFASEGDSAKVQPEVHFAKSQSDTPLTYHSPAGNLCESAADVHF